MATAEFTEGSLTDHREAAITALRPVAKRLGDIYMGANDVDEDAWRLFGMASDKADHLLESCDLSSMSSGHLHIVLGDIVALMQGAQLILEALGSERSIEDEGSLLLVTRYAQIVRAQVDALDKQSVRERSGVQKVEVQHG